MASPVVWIRQLSGASLDLSHSDPVRYRCYKRKSVGAHPVHLQICVLLLRRAYTWYIVRYILYMSMQIYMIVLMSRLLRGVCSCCFDSLTFHTCSVISRVDKQECATRGWVGPRRNFLLT